MRNKEGFRVWLQRVRKKNGKELLDSTIDCYLKTIDNISDDMMGIGIIDKNIYNMTIDEFDNEYKKIVNNSSFISKNSRGKNRHISALEHYNEFLRNSNKSVPLVQ